MEPQLERTRPSARGKYCVSQSFVIPLRHMEQFDVVVIGSGQGGVPFAVKMARQGRSVCLFESGPLGGTCVNNGCTPSKSFLASAHSAGRARRAGTIGVHADVTVDFPAVMRRVNGIIASFRDENEKRLRDAGVAIVRERARFTAPNVVAGPHTEVTAPTILINTGCSAATPPIPGLDDVPHLTNETFFGLTELPQSFVVIGGGYIGLELGQGVVRCGASVQIVEPADRVLSNEEPDVSDVLARSLRDDGIGLHLRARVERIRPHAGGVHVELAGGTTLEAEGVLVATGRTPNTRDLQLQRAGIACDARGFIQVDDYLRTPVEGVYAIGDVAGQPQFTHVSWEDHRRVLSTLHGTPRKRDDRTLAYAVFTEPQIGRAGLTFAQAEARGIDARAETLPLAEVARGIEWGDERGFFRAVVDRRTEALIGATFAGYEMGELIHVLLTYIQRGATWHDLADAMHVHPTFAEGLPTLARKFASH